MASESGGPINWVVQIGPELASGTTEGYFNSNAATFYLSAPDGQVTAFVSTTAGGSWEEIPPNRAVGVSGDNTVLWQLQVPGGATAKFLIGPN